MYYQRLLVNKIKMGAETDFTSKFIYFYPKMSPLA